MKKRVLSLLFCILILLTAALPAFAAESGSVTVMFYHDGKPVADASFQIYKAAEWTGSGYSLLEPFSKYSVRLADESSSEEWKAIASTLASYAARDGIQPLASGVTDADGKALFEGLSDGLYLVTGAAAELDDLTLLPRPMLVTVPYTSSNGVKEYDVTTEPKYEVQKETDDTIVRRALKIWKDDGNEASRPKDVTVQLLCDGKVFDEQVLSASNNWAYTWEGLDAAHDWQLTEKDVPEGYKVEITRQDVTFTVTNTNDNPPPPPTDTPNEPTLPQTGLLWWPVPLLGGTGALLLFLGIFLLLRKKDGADA